MDKTLRFEFKPDQTNQNEGWGYGQLWLDEQLFWHGTASIAHTDTWLHWTWVDMLDYLGQNWAALTLEQNYPFPWLDEVKHLGEAWDVGQDRWSKMADGTTVDQEQTELLEFLYRHNLAQAWQGVNLPALFWIREGQNIRLISDSGKSYRADYASGVQALTDLGEQLAQAYASSTNPRVHQAVTQWNNRLQTLTDQDFVSVSTGWPEQDLHMIQAGSTAAEFWFNGQNRVNCAANDNEFMAAARMLRHTGNAQSVAQILQLIRQLPQAKATAELDELSRECLAQLQKQDLRDPWAQGYATAQWLANSLNLDPAKRCDPERILLEWGVQIQDENLLIPDLDALAVWGARGPALLINAHDKAKSLQKVRRRSTLAHEIAHLLLDRHDGLPVLEVLGGRVNMFVEQRANAFAAELLLPRMTAGRIYQKAHDLESALKNMSRHYEVGKSLAINQLHNSGSPTGHDLVALQHMQRSHAQN